MAWELAFMQWGNGWWRMSVLDQLIPWLTHLGSHGAVILFILLAWILTKKRDVLFTLLCLYGVQSVVVYGLKFLIRRPRPPAFREGTPGLFSGPGEILDPSFPSAHTLYAFMIATVLSTRFPRYRVVFFVAAGFIGWTRIYLGLHYPTDVLAGALLGYGLTELFLRWVRFRPERGLDSLSN